MRELLTKMRRLHLVSDDILMPSELQYTTGEPYFDDGNVVLLTDPSLVAFKVHRASHIPRTKLPSAIICVQAVSSRGIRRYSRT